MIVPRHQKDFVSRRFDVVSLGRRFGFKTLPGEMGLAGFISHELLIDLYGMNPKDVEPAVFFRKGMQTYGDDVSIEFFDHFCERGRPCREVIQFGEGDILLHPREDGDYTIENAIAETVRYRITGEFRRVVPKRG